MSYIIDRLTNLVRIVSHQRKLLNQRSEELKTATTVINTNSIAIQLILKALRYRDPEVREDLKKIFSMIADEMEDNVDYSSDHLRSYASILDDVEADQPKRILRVVPSWKFEEKERQ